MKTIVTILITLFSLSTNAQSCNCGGIVAPSYDGDIVIYETPNGTIIDTLRNDLVNENFLFFTISNAQEGFLSVNIGLGRDTISINGWIKPSFMTGTYARNYSGAPLKLYESPDNNSNVRSTIPKYYEEVYKIIECNGEWVEVEIIIEGVVYSGWLEKNMQCPNSYTYCN
jgi:hypothetical protein